MFTDWQKVRMQETSSEIPSGSMPRSLDVILRNEAVDKCKAGDNTLFCGTLIVIPDITQFNLPGVKVQQFPLFFSILIVLVAGAREDVQQCGSRRHEGTEANGSARSHLSHVLSRIYSQAGRFAQWINQPEGRGGGQCDRRAIGQRKKVCFVLLEGKIAHFILKKKNHNRDIFDMSQRSTIYADLSRSVAPTVFGHDEIKRGLLLMLFGGVHKQTMEGINLRGDINICIVGDPSTSKSQFLK